MHDIPVEVREAAQAYTRLPVVDAEITADTYVIEPRGPLPTAPRIVIDRRTGRVIEARERARRAVAFTYRTSPARDRAPELLELPLPIVGSTLDGPLLSATSCVDRNAVRTILGRSIHACTLERVAIANAVDELRYPPSDTPRAADPFAEVSAYFHTARALAYFGWQGKKIDVVASARIASGLLDGDDARAARADLPLEPLPAAFFLPSADAFGELNGSPPAIWLGQGEVRDFSYDGDVVYHETTHAVLQEILPPHGAYRFTSQGVTSEPEAIEEGLADYFAAAISGDPLVGEWVGGEYPSEVRSVKTGTPCSDWTGEPHADGLLLASALWNANVDPKIVFAALHSVTELSFASVTRTISRSLDTDSAERFATEIHRLGMGDQGCDLVSTITPEQSLSGPFVVLGTDQVRDATIVPSTRQIRVEVPEPARGGTLRVSFSAAKTPPALFGRRDATFDPVILVQWDRPIAWGAGTHDAAVTVMPAPEPRHATSIPIPRTITEIYLQIANAGAADGTYDHLSVTLEARSSAKSGGCQQAPHSASGWSALALLLFIGRYRRCKRCSDSR